MPHTWNDDYLSGEYLQHWDYREPSQELVGAVAAGVIPVGGVTLDVGCGAGNEAIFLAACGFHSVGVDLSPAALEIAGARSNDRGVSVDWRVGDVLALPVDSGSIDFVNDRGCFHHIVDRDRPRYAAEIARVLKPGGVLFLRGCRQQSEEFFNLVTNDTVRAFFNEPEFHVERVLPLTLISDAGTLKANLAVVRRV